MNEINFLNTISEEKQISLNSWLKQSIFCLLLSLFCISVFNLKNHFKVKKLQNEKLALEQRLLNFDNIVKEKNKVEDYRKNILKKFEKIQKISSKKSKSLIVNFLSELTLAIPENLYLNKLEYNSKTGIILKGYSLIAQDVINFIQNLSTLKSVENVKLEYLNLKEDKTDEINFFHEFSITLKLIK